ncbi:MAG: terminase small subunit [Gammaproteobacteria bacterium]|nr:terminase small subunit [Gammaproteobacteria bacterium]
MKTEEDAQKLGSTEGIEELKSQSVAIPTHFTATMKPKHVKFAIHYAETGNATQSAIISGSSAGASRSYGSKMAKRDDVRELVEFVRQAIISQSELNPEYVIDKLREVIKRGMTGVEIKGPGGKGTGVFRMSDAASVVRSLELIGRYHGMWEGDGPKVDVDVQVGVANLADGSASAPDWDAMVERYLTIPAHEKTPQAEPEGPETAS